MMLAELNIYLEPSGDQWPAVSMGSLFHGWLMQRVTGYYAKKLHQPGPKPFSQHLEVKRGEVIWHISTLNEEAFSHLLKPLADNTPRFVELEAKGRAFPVKGSEMGKVYASYKDLADGCYLAQDPARRLVFFATTPVAFRSNREYQIFPSEFHIMQSLVNRWNAFADAVSLDDEEAFRALVAALRITRYRLESKTYHIEGIRIPGFTGRWEMSIKGPEALRRLATMLGMYADFAGIGIKTALGMGGVKLEEIVV